MTSILGIQCIIFYRIYVNNTRRIFRWRVRHLKRTNRLEMSSFRLTMNACTVLSLLWPLKINDNLHTLGSWPHRAAQTTSQFRRFWRQSKNSRRAIGVCAPVSGKRHTTRLNASIAESLFYFLHIIKQKIVLQRPLPFYGSDHRIGIWSMWFRLDDDAYNALYIFTSRARARMRTKNYLTLNLRSALYLHPVFIGKISRHSLPFANMSGVHTRFVISLR